jgi:uncharacterized protein (DUF2062 family)/2-polyprenyl-3-methyl-5-hydroxy-6-metoxy-1,4-benzoquinol methylase
MLSVVLEEVADLAAQSGAPVFYLIPLARLDIIARRGPMGARRDHQHRPFSEPSLSGRCRVAAAIGLGAFVACLPFAGSSARLCASLASAFRLSEAPLRLAASISTPVLAPVIAVAEIQLGCYVLDRAAHPISLGSVIQTSPWHFSGDLLLGLAVAGAMLATGAAAATWTFGRSWFDPRQEHVIAGAAANYLRVGLQAWRTANAKLRFDPVYRESIRSIDWPAEGRVLDLGCGRGLMLSVVARHLDRAGGSSRPCLHGIDYRPRMVRLASRALGDRATIERADLTTCRLPPSRVAMLFDVLHCLPESEQDRLLARLRDSVEPGGVLLLREADAAGRAGFAAVMVCNRIVALLQGRWGRRFHFRTSAGWIDVLSRFGFEAEAVPNGEATPFANLLIRARRVR